MGILDSLEQRLDKLVNGSFSKAFKSDVQPTELGAIMQQEMDAKSREIDGRLTAPNLFVIDLGEGDYSRLQSYVSVLSGELEKLANEYATQQRYALVGSPQVTFKLEPSFDTGIFRISSDFGQPIPTPASPVQTGPAEQSNVSVNMIQDVTPPRLISVSGNTFLLTEPITKIGRGDQADIKIEDAGVSRLHCAVILGSEVVVKDLGSTNGTVVDGRIITEAVLNEGSIISIGSTTLTYRSR